MIKNTGLEYEELVKRVYSSIAKQNKVKNINIQHNIVLEGKSGTKHQIDIYWEFSYLDITHKVVVEVKDYATKVNQEKIHAFKAVLDDIAGQPRGIYITRTGYQAGARKYAEHHGIQLYELRAPTDKDWEGKMRNIYLNIEYNIPHIDNLRVVIDGEWVKRYCRQKGMPVPEHLDLKALSNMVYLYDNKGNRLMSIQEKINDLCKKNLNGMSGFIKEEFSEIMYINTLREDIPRVKIKEISFKLSFNVYNDKVEILGDDIVKFILKDVIKDTVKLIGPSMEILNKARNDTKV